MLCYTILCYTILYHTILYHTITITITITITFLLLLRSGGLWSLAASDRASVTTPLREQLRYITPNLPTNITPANIA